MRSGIGVVSAWGGDVHRCGDPRGATAILRAVPAFHPDVVHVHNNFPLLAPAIFPAIRDETPSRQGLGSRIAAYFVPEGLTEDLSELHGQLARPADFRP